MILEKIISIQERVIQAKEKEFKQIERLFEHYLDKTGPLLVVRGSRNSDDHSLSFGLILNAENDFIGLPSVLISDT